MSKKAIIVIGGCKKTYTRAAFDALSPEQKLAEGITSWGAVYNSASNIYKDYRGTRLVYHSLLTCGFNPVDIVFLNSECYSPGHTDFGYNTPNIASPTKDNVLESIKWLQGASDAVFYYVGGGDTDGLYTTNGQLTKTELDAAFDAIEPSITNKIHIVIDSFISQTVGLALTPTSGKSRNVIMFTSANTTWEGNGLFLGTTDLFHRLFKESLLARPVLTLEVILLQ